MVLLGLVQRYNRLPSEILHLEDPYECYCFDEACALIMSRLDNKEEFYEETHFATPSQLYKHVLRR